MMARWGGVILLLLAAPALALDPPAQAAICPSEGAALVWTPNEETDMAGYRLYVHSTAAVQHPASQRVDIPHTPSSIVTLPNGEQIIRHRVALVLPDGPVFFGLTARDQAGNESALTNVETCTVETVDTIPPGTPRNFRLELTIVNPSP